MAIADRRRSASRVDPLRVLMARAEARAILFEACEYQTIEEAAGPLLHYAYNTRLIERYGEAAIYGMIEKAFAHCRCEDDGERA